jgi:hypothetical protein
LNTGFYRLDELDGTELQESFARNQLKKFFTQAEFATSRIRSSVDIMDSNESEDAEDDDAEETRRV